MAVGIDISLQDENGKVLKSIDDAKNLLADLLSVPINEKTYPMLASIDPYGDTTFNGIQIKRLLSEWEDLLKKAKSAEEKALLKDIETLALRCHEEVHLYLKFIGD